MKKTNKHLIIISFLGCILSCNTKKETRYSETRLPIGYTIKLPADTREIREGTWKISEHSYLEIYSTKDKSQKLESDFQIFSSSRDSDNNYVGKILIRTNDINENNLEGIIAFYEKEIKGKGVGLVTLTNYIVFAVVQDDNTRFQITSSSLSDNNFEEIVKIVKSISAESKKLKFPEINKFDKIKALEDGYQVFTEDGFMVKCKGKIKLDNLRIQQMKQMGQYDNTRPYHVYHNGTDFNINVNRFDIILAGMSIEEINNYNKNDLDYYQTKFNEMSIKNSRGKFKENDAVYYELTQDGRTSKAVFFHHKMKGYLLQVTDEKNTEKKFQEFINSFEIIN